jgi:hypothetical protein
MSNIVRHRSDIANDFGYIGRDIADDFARVSRSSAQLQTAPAQNGSLAAMSRGLVQLFRHRAGRGPTRARSFWAGEDALLALFGGGYTKAEKTLWEQGRPETAASYRQAVLGALEPGMRAVVEDSVGRTVEAVLAAAHHDPDVMATVFLLEPLGGRGSAEVGRWGAGDSPAPHSPLDASTNARA